MQEHEVRFEAFLNQKELKFTQPRRLILDTVFSLHEHFDAEQLYDLIHQVSKAVSRATVYRTIPLLVEAGLIQRSVRSESRDKFEHILGHPQHAHWVCRTCGAVMETDMHDIMKLIHNKAKVQNFRLDDVNLVLNGICWKCQHSENESQ